MKTASGCVSILLIILGISIMIGYYDNFFAIIGFLILTFGVYISDD